MKYSEIELAARALILAGYKKVGDGVGVGEERRALSVALAKAEPKSRLEKAAASFMSESISASYKEMLAAAIEAEKEHNA